MALGGNLEKTKCSKLYLYWGCGEGGGEGGGGGWWWWGGGVVVVGRGGGGGGCVTKERNFGKFRSTVVQYVM